MGHTIAPMSGQPVSVTYLGLARSIVDADGESIQAESPMNVGDLLQLLSARHGPQFRQGLYRGDGRLRSFIQICVDDRDIEELQGLRTPLDRGEEVSIVIGVYPLEGG
jgi:molybdopterin converting factor small subunit